MRHVVVIASVGLLLATLAGVKAGEIGKLVSYGKKAKAAGPPPEAVTTAIASEQSWEETIADVGTVTASKGLTLASEVPGVVTAIHFESGDFVKAGAPIVDLDTNVERAQLASAVARRDLATTTLNRTETLVATGSIPQQQYDTDHTQLEVTRKDVDALRAQIGLKSVRAPFDGQLGIRLVNVGQYLAPGAPIASLERLKPVFVDFTTPQQRLPELQRGMPVRVTLADESVTRDGVIDAIDPAVDATTRTVRVRASVPNEDEVLRAGMFVEVKVVLPRRETVLAVPATAVLHAPYGDSVFVVETKPSEKIAHQTFVRTGEARGDFIAITNGLKAGDEVVAAGAFKLRNGSKVDVTTNHAPAPELAPKPPNR